MCETKNIATISVVTDTETGQENIGDVNGSFDEKWLYDHIKHHGHQQISDTLAYLNWQVWETVRKINGEKSLESSTQETTICQTK